jgi:hypothetical protein
MNSFLLSGLRRAASGAIAVVALGGLVLATTGCEQGNVAQREAAVTTNVAQRDAAVAAYKGKPWEGKPQVIPGKAWTAYYDVGGEGVAYHDETPGNHGSGELNNGPEPKNHFREKEGVDLSYTKSAFDKGQDGAILPIDEFYQGWTAPGEFVNLTVEVKEAGTYIINLKASANNPGAAVSVSVMGGGTTGPVGLEPTGYYHTWTMYNHIGELTLAKGINVLTFKIEKEGQMNIMWLEFVRKK